MTLLSGQFITSTEKIDLDNCTDSPALRTNLCFPRPVVYKNGVPFGFVEIEDFRYGFDDHKKFNTKKFIASSAVNSFIVLALTLIALRIRNINAHHRN